MSSVNVKPAEAGTVSHGTLRTEDLLERFADELEHHVQDNAEAWCSDEGRAERDALVALVWDAREADPDSDEASDIVDQLQDALSRFAPEDHYFGAHEGDGSDFGYWPHIGESDQG